MFGHTVVESDNAFKLSLHHGEPEHLRPEPFEEFLNVANSPCRNDDSEGGGSA